MIIFFKKQFFIKKTFKKLSLFRLTQFHNLNYKTEIILYKINFKKL